MIGRPSPSANAPRGEAVSDIVNAHVVEPGPCADDLPGPVDVCHVPARLVSRDHPGIAGLARQGLQDANRRRREVNRAGASFPVGEMNLGRVEIDMLPAQGQDLAHPAAGEHQQAQRRNRRRLNEPVASNFRSVAPKRPNSVGVRNRSRDFSGSIRNFVLWAIVMKEKGASYGNREGTIGPAVGGA